MDVGEWLRGLGLANTGEVQRQQDRRGRASATDGGRPREARHLGIGDRRRLLNAIAELARRAVFHGWPAAPPLGAAPPSGPEVSAERRPITVMFCDLVGSTSLAAKLDAEDWRNLVNAYLDEASAAVTDLGGHVLKKLGDGLMALFGYPQAQENDAERAVRAALAIQRALAELNARNAARARRSSPRGSASRPGRSSSTPAAKCSAKRRTSPRACRRRPSLARCLSPLNVQRQVAGLFVVEDQGARELKGVSEPVPLFRIVRASGGGRGRRADSDAVRRPRGGTGRCCAPLGARSRGRRPARADRRRARPRQVAADRGVSVAAWPKRRTPGSNGAPRSSCRTRRCIQSPNGAGSFWRGCAGRAAPRRPRRHAALIGLDPAEDAPLLAPLVRHPAAANRAARLFPPEELRRQAIGGNDFLGSGGCAIPAACPRFRGSALGRSHLARLSARARRARCASAAYSWWRRRGPNSVRRGACALTIGDFAVARSIAPRCARMVGELLAPRRYRPRSVIEGVDERTGGVPLFVEEVTRLLLERGDQGGVQAIPPTLQQSLAARLDRLGPAREVAQVGAVLGRDFAYTPAARRRRN